MHSYRENQPVDTLVLRRGVVLAWFSVMGAWFGIIAGLLEAVALYFIPDIPGLTRPSVSYVIWFLDPLVGLVLFGLLGCLLGLAASRNRRTSRWRIARLAAAGLGMVGGYIAVAFSLVKFHLWKPHLYATTFAAPVLGFLAFSSGTLLAFKTHWYRASASSHSMAPSLLSRLAGVLFGVTAGMVSGVLYYAVRGPASPVPALAHSYSPTHRPNIVLIVLDTVRADHLSVYGYSRPTTPNLDGLAGQGVLFENAVAPSSWTLPSHSSILTGLLPHQHGAGLGGSLDEGPPTLASLLASRGYETAGFNGNWTFGLAGWGLARGFGTYEDASVWIRHNLAGMLPGRALRLWAYLHDDSRFDRRDARELNQGISRRVRSRSGQPLFLFINYMDAHYPYVASAPDTTYFGRGPERAWWDFGLAYDLIATGRKPSSEGEKAAQLNGYDNCLAFLDKQVGQLVQFLRTTPDWSNTFVIITADHGEAFGEHGRYGHGWDLAREVIRVPLIILGPGIPHGKRVSQVVATRRIFATVLDLTRKSSRAPAAPDSLRGLWESGTARPGELRGTAISELAHALLTSKGESYLSIMTDDWHFITRSDGQGELYHWPEDPQEKLNLWQSPQYHDTREVLLKEIYERLASSRKPWRGAGYLGSATLKPEQNELLRSLPYD